MREESDSRRDISRYLVVRDYAPVPEALILGRTPVLRVVIGGEVSLLFHHRRKKLQSKTVREHADTAGTFVP